jgi:hypothetical protein
MIYSINTPTSQIFYNNFCLRANGMRTFFGQHCQYFIAHVPGLNKDPDTVSFESVCSPGSYVLQKDYRFVVVNHDKDENYGKRFKKFDSITS